MLALLDVTNPNRPGAKPELQPERATMFGKIFEQIYDSSIAEDWTVRVVFQDFIVLADINGVVDRTPEAIARRTNVPLEIVKTAIAKLESPDPLSRSPVDDGRRIRRLEETRPWGWEIINYQRYRAIASGEQQRENTKIRTRKWRERRTLQTGDAPVTLGDAGDAKQRQKQRQKQKHKKRESTEAPPPTGNGNGSGEFKLSPEDPPPVNKAKGTRDEILRFCKSISVPESDGEYFFNKWEGNGWSNNGEKVKDWRAVIRSWKAAGYLPSQKSGGQSRTSSTSAPPPGIQLRAVRDEIEKHPANHQSVFYNSNCSEEQRAHLKQLRGRANHLNSLIAGGGAQ